MKNLWNKKSFYRSFLLVIVSILLCFTLACSGDFFASPSTSVPESLSPTPTETPVFQTPNVPIIEDPNLVTLPRYSEQEVLDYFQEIAFSSEYEGDHPFIRRWDAPISYQILGEFTLEDVDLLERLSARLNKIPGFPGIDAASPSQEEVSIKITFAPMEDLGDLIDGYKENNWGFCRVWASDNVINRAEIVIACDEPDEEERLSVVMEEFIQSLGLLQDSYHYPKSIFYQEWSLEQWPGLLDWTLVQMLYHPLLTCNMPMDAAMEILGAHLSQ